MVRFRDMAAACGLALAVAAGATLLTPAAVQAAEFSREVGKPLQEAHAAMKTRQWSAAIEKIKEAQAVPNKKPHEQYAIDQLLAYVLYAQKKYGEAAPVYERMLESGLMPAADVPARTKEVAKMYFEVKDLDKCIKWAKRGLEKLPDDQDLLVILAQSYYLKEDYKQAISSMSTAISEVERAGQRPKEDWLRLVQTSQLKLGNKAGAADALKILVRHYQKRDDWGTLLSIYANRDHSDRVQLGYYRLMLDADVLWKAADFVEMTQLTMDMEVPAEGLRVIEKGFQSGVLKATDKTQQQRYERLLDGIKKRVAESRAALPKRAEEAAQSADGQNSVLLGQIYLSTQQYDKAIDAIQRGLKKGVTDADEAQVSLGIAYMRKGQKDLARQAFKTVKKGSQWGELAELWALRA